MLVTHNNYTGANLCTKNCTFVTAFILIELAYDVPTFPTADTGFGKVVLSVHLTQVISEVNLVLFNSKFFALNDCILPSTALDC